VKVKAYALMQSAAAFHFKFVQSFHDKEDVSFCKDLQISMDDDHLIAYATTRFLRARLYGRMCPADAKTMAKHLRQAGAEVGGASALVTFICVLCTLRTQISRETLQLYNFTHYSSLTSPRS
jgi:hypothetical protein